VVATFGDLLHRAGVATTPERSGRLAEMLALVAPATTTELYWCARLALVVDRRDVEIFDRVFAEVFRGVVDVADIARNPNAAVAARSGSSDAPPPQPAGPAGATTDGRSDAQRLASPGTGDGGRDSSDEEGVLAAAADREVLGATAFGACTPDELERLGRLIARLTVVPPSRTGRRHRPHRHRGEVDWRSTLRRAHRTAGDPVGHVRRRRVPRPRRVVLLADVSGSMEPYARAYLYLLHGAVRAVRAEAFVFATRLTRLTRHLASSDAGLALAQAKAAAPDWAGGTRIGAALARFNDEWGRRGMARGAVVVVVSDAWEPGDVGLLAREIERLSRMAHRIIWVNPRVQSAQFRPTTAGMTSVLPWIDDLVSGHSLERLDDVLAAIARP
jgi:uncharacterized protein with von Willebrand factor type A (vWA) domain